MTRLLLPLVLLALALPACVSAYQNKEVAELSIEPGVTTKAELLQQLGTPRGVRAQGDGKVLSFSYGEVNGTGYGVGSFGVRFAIEATQLAADVLEVFVGPDGVVRSYRLAQNDRRSPKWP